MQMMDCVEVTVEKERYTKHGVHKGMQGWICLDDFVNGTWLVNFPQCGEKEDIAEISVKEEDLKVIPVMYAAVNEEIKTRFEEAEKNAETKRLSGDEVFTFCRASQGQSVKDFWAWALSRLLMDGPRGDLAEFIVRMALGEDLDTPKRGWGECDIKDRDGFRIEVKCSSLLQEWERDKPSTPSFSIAQTMECDIDGTEGNYRYVGRKDTGKGRRSEAYVFCLFACDNRETADPLNLDQWQFWVVPTDLLNQKMGEQKRITPAALKKLGIETVKYDKLAEAVCAIKAKIRNA